MPLEDIALTMQPRVGPKTAAHLISVFGSAAGIYRATERELIGEAGLNPAIARDICRGSSRRDAEKEISFCSANGVKVLVCGKPETGYPRLLAECPDRPHVLYYKGDPEALGGNLLSMVGTRRATTYGQRVCNSLVGGVAARVPDLTIVSGLASGIDGCSHRAALASGVRTVAVSPVPLNKVYPPQHRTLAQEILRAGGGMLSEYHSAAVDLGTNFLARNRIIAGISMGTVVVESPLRGGSMATARIAAGYARYVMAVPGRADDLLSAGTNALIRDDIARLVTSGDDIIKEMHWDEAVPPPSAKVPEIPVTPAAAKLLGRIPYGSSIAADELGLQTGLDAGTLFTLLLELEFAGRVRKLPGQLYEKI